MTPGATILVVDDERHLRESLAELLGAEGYQVIQAADGDEALASLRRPEVTSDAIFLDLKMPRRDGLATLKVLMAEPEIMLLLGKTYLKMNKPTEARATFVKLASQHADDYRADKAKLYIQFIDKRYAGKI